VIAVVEITARAPGGVKAAVTWAATTGTAVVFVDLVVVATTSIVVAGIAGTTRAPKGGKTSVAWATAATWAVVLGHLIVVAAATVVITIIKRAA
jgi:hypothetical protein